MNINFLLIIIQIVLLLFLVYRESKKYDKNFILIFVILSYLILVQFQSLWILNEFKSSNYNFITIVGNSFSYNSYSKTNLLFFFAVILFFISVIVLDRLRFFPKKTESLKLFFLPFFSYLLILFWFTFFSYLLISKVGGLDSAINNPGQMVEGQTVFILMLGLSKWPLLFKLSSKSKLNLIDYLLFVSYIIVITFNSRFLTAFAIVQLLFVYHYRICPIKIKNIIFVAIPFFLIFIVFGIYRDFSYRYNTIGISEASSQFTSVKDNFSILDWFFTGNVEAFSGTAGIIQFADEHHDFNIDYGLSEFSVLFNFIPNKIRNTPNSIINDLNIYLLSVYPYKGGSVVPSGLETSFGHFSYFGFFGYNILIAFLPIYFHKYIISNRNKNIYLFISVHLLNSVRASIFGAFIFFGASEVFTFLIFRTLIKSKSSLL